MGAVANAANRFDASDLERFVAAQDPVYETVLAELRGGRKRTHWMWFVFPQLRGLGFSSLAQYYGIASLDEARALRDESRRVIAELQSSYAEQAGVRQLKIKHNNFLGYYIETPQAAGETLLKPPLNSTFIHRQTMAGAMRFTTNALVDLEARIASAADRALALELEAFDRLRHACLAEGERLRGFGAAFTSIPTRLRASSSAAVCWRTTAASAVM